MALKDIKDSYPFQLAEYGVATKIYMDTTFAWWAHQTLKKMNHIILKVKYKYWLNTYKFRIKVPNNTKQEMKFDRENGNTLWWEAVWQEIKNVCLEF